MNQVPAALTFKSNPKLPVFIQDEANECGHVCVAMISHFFGHSLDLFALRARFKPATRGMTLLGLKTLCEQLGFTTRALQLNLDELHMVKCPAILHWNLNHFVVLKQVKKNAIVIHDPAVGLRTCSMEEVSAAFTGIVLEVEKSDDFQVIRDKQSLRLYDLVSAGQGIHRYVFLLLLLSLSIELFSLINPLFMQYVTDSVILSGESNNLSIIAAAFVILVCIQAFSEYLRGNVVVYLTTNLTEQFSSNVVKHLLKLPLTFFEQRHKGDIQSKFLSIDQIQRKISTDFINTVLDGAMIMVNFLVMFIYSQLLTLVVCLSLMLYWVLRYASYAILKRQTEASIQHHAKASSLFLETLQVIMPIKSFLKEGMRFNAWRNAYIPALNADIRVSRMTVIYQAASQLLFNLEHILVVCLGAYLVVANKFSAGMLIAFLAYRLLLVSKASSFIQNIFDYKLISIQLTRLSDILFQHPEQISTGEGVAENVLGAIQLINVTFQYSEHEPPVFKHINLDIKAGEKVAIIGPSGCGKTTLLKVMMGLLNKTDGEIYIDGVALDVFGLKNYRELTACVMQEDALISGSILDNIVFFDETIDRARVYQMARIACIDEVIASLPMGYETQVGEMGASLSGGQKQRILLARALYKAPKILFLDEATSHLDVENEKIINQSLKALNITQIIIAHREESIRMADRVIDLRHIMQKPS